MNRIAFTATPLLALALAAAISLAACGGDDPEGTAGSNQQVEGDAAVSGEVTYLTRIAMPPNARVEVTLENISTDDPSSVIVGRQSIPDAKNPPIPFEVAYSSDEVNTEAGYAVKATIFRGDDPWMINRDTVPVITDGNPTSDVQVIVDPVG